MEFMGSVLDILFSVKYSRKIYFAILAASEHLELHRS